MPVSPFLEAVLRAGKLAGVLYPILSPNTMSPSPFLPGDGCSDSSISSVLSDSKACKTESRGAENAQVSSSEVAVTAFAVTFPVSCARNGSLPLGSPERSRSQCTGNSDLIVPTVGPCCPGVWPCSPGCREPQKLLSERFLCECWD